MKLISYRVESTTLTATATAGANLFKPRHDPYVGGNAHSDRGLRSCNVWP